MQVFHIRYRNAQGALMRILNAVSRRGLDFTSVHAEYAGQDHAVTLLLEVSHKQMGQLYREWHAIVDVIDVRRTRQRASQRSRRGPRELKFCLRLGMSAA
jgi:acetolactate synthase small subunit